MIKCNLENGTPILVIKIEHYVKGNDFARALTDHYFGLSADFNLQLKKAEAFKILKRSLFFTGLKGEYESDYFEASFELGEQRNLIFNEAIKWVENNYPHLILK